MSDADPRPSLLSLLLQLFWILFRLVAPIAVLAWLPPPWALGTALLAAAGAWLAARLGWMRAASGCDELLAVGVIGFALSVFRHAAIGWWRIPLTVVLLLAGLALAGWLSRRLGLKPAEPEPIDPPPWKGTSAWRGGDLQTPQGEPVRSFGWSEIGMGGPTYGSYLLPEGVLLIGLGASARFSDSGRYFAAPLPSRDRWGLLVL
ncbi:MAG: hypothetical protein QM581_05435, partial [Pseudomonas sp.]